ncbi:hypothetical protein T484DRAFT_1788759 [Baffinella frigidus]|nr:hypothetical protein T484DRAFT_1788759 [Cryptophyta sp. CCMP2293]
MRTAACPHLVCLLLICHFGSTLAKNGAVRADGSARLSFDAPLVVLGGVRTLVEFSLLAAGFPENTSLRVEVLGTHIAMDNAAPAASGILDVVVDSSGFLEMTGQVQLYSDPSLSEFDRFDLALLFRAGANGTILAITPPHPVRVIPAPLCILPALLVVIMAVVSRNVIMALLAGLALGGIFISPGFNPVAGLMRASDTFLYAGLRDSDMGLLLFTWFMSGLVGLISKNGGALGLGRRFRGYATSARREQGRMDCEKGSMDSQDITVHAPASESPEITIGP